MHRNSVFALFLFSQVALNLVLLQFWDAERAFLLAAVLGYAAGWALPRFEVIKVVIFGMVPLLFLTVLALPMFSHINLTGLPEFQYALPLLMTSQFMLLMGWLQAKGKSLHLHWGWILLLGIYLFMQSSGMLAIGSHRGKFVLNVFNLIVAGMALRPHLRSWWQGLLFLLPWIALETWAGLDPDTIITFWNYPIGFAVALGAWCLVIFARQDKRPWLLPGIVLALSSIFAFGFFQQLQERSSYVEVTELYQPPFSELQAVNLAADSPESLHGKVVYIDLWSINCGYCRYMFPEIERLHKEYAGDPKVRIISVTSEKFDKREKIDAFVAKEGFEFPVYYDISSQIMNHFSAEGVPLSFIVTPEGKIVDYHPGFNPMSGKWYWERVRSRLKELGA